MRLSTESFVLRERFGDSEAFRMIKAAGFDCVDYSYYHLDEAHPALGDNYRAYAHELRAQLDALSLCCNQAHAPYSFLYGMEQSESDPEYRRLLRAIESAAILGASYIVVHSITPPADLKATEFENYNYEFYKGLQPYAEKFGIKIAVENLFFRDPKMRFLRPKLGTPRDLRAMLDRLDSEAFVACVDIGHASNTWGEPQDFITALGGEYIGCMHFQDGDYVDDRHMLPFLGQFDWHAIMRAIKAAGYRGDLTFEIVKYLKGLPNELLPAALALAAQCGRYLISLYESC